MPPKDGEASAAAQLAVEILEHMTDAFVALDREWRYVYVNRRAAEIFGRRPEQLVGRHIWTEFPEGVGQPFQLAYEEAVREQRPRHLEAYYPPYDRWFENRIFPSPNGLAIFFHDITERKLAERELARSEERYRVLAHAVGDMVWQTDGSGNPLAPTPGWEDLTGRDTSAGGDPQWIEAVHPADRDEVLENWRCAMRTGRPFECVARVGQPGEWRHIRARGVPVRRNGQIDEWIGVIFDITDQVRAEETLRRAALEDPLTHLPNRALFLERLRGLLSHRRHAPAAVLYIDIDGFKSVNDRFGHAAGDQLLCRIAERLREHARPSDVVSRLSGDEFAVLCDDLHDEDEAITIARRIARVLSEPVDGAAAQVSASVGVAFIGDQDDDPEAVLRASDAAMFRAKARGGAAVEVFDERLRRRMRNRLAIEEQLRSGLTRDAAGLAYQPIVGSGRGSPLAVEALLRWRARGGGALPAAETVSVAEQTGLIGPLGAQVLLSACRQAAAWERAGTPVRIAVNVSMRQIARPAELVRDVEAALTATGLAPELLTLELTENVLMENVPDAERVLVLLRRLGVTFQIDDFGVGHSSLARLHRLPVDAVKIDRSFVDGLPRDPSSRRMIEAIVALAHGFGIAVVAEGIEREEQLAAVRELGCDAFQGFAVARPAPGDAVPAAIDRGRRAVAAAGQS